MFNIKIFLFCLSIILLNSTIILPDNVEFRLVETTNAQTIGGNFFVDLQIRITSGTTPRTLHSITAYINYDASRLTEWGAPTPSDPSTNWAFSFLDGYSITVTNDTPNDRYIILVTAPNVNAGNNLTQPGSPPGWAVTTTYQSITKLMWTIASLGDVSIYIDDGSDDAAYFNNYTNAPKGGATDWAVTNNDLVTATPVELSAFNAKLNGHKVELSWETKTEVNNYGFEVQRSLTQTLSEGEGLNNWEKIGFIEGHGNSNSPKNYSFTDNNPYGGSKFIYRIKQIDNDGKYEYSDEVEVEIVPNEFALYQNYPNPFNPATNIQFSLPKATRINLSVYSLLGEKITTLMNEDKEAGFYNVLFDASILSSGVYIYRLESSEFVSNKKLMLLK